MFSKFTFPKSISIASALIFLTIKFFIKLFEEIIFIASSLLELVILVFEISNSELIILTPHIKFYFHLLERKDFNNYMIKFKLIIM